MTEPLPAGLAPWAWQKAAHLMVPAPAAPGPSTSPGRTPDLAHLLEAIGAAHAHRLAPHGYDPHDLAPLGLALLSRLPTEGHDEQLRLAADALRAEIAGDTVTYVVNRNLNVSNHCVKHCSFCAFRRDAGDQGAYWLSEAELEARAAEAQQLGATELCIQGGLNPAATINGSQLAYAERLLEILQRAAPGIHLHAFSPQELLYFAQEDGLELDVVLKRLQAVGLASIPGTAAEVLSEPVRRVLCPEKLSARAWVAVMLQVHRCGLAATSTLMAGHIESPADLVAHLLTLVALQCHAWKNEPIHRM